MQYQPMTQIFPGAAPVPAGQLPTTRVMGVNLVNATADRAVATLTDGARRTVFFLNAHCANMRATTPAYRAALGRADHVLPDGIGVELAARMQGKALTANLNGTDFVPHLLARAAQMGWSVFLLGGTPGTAEAASEKLRLTIPGLAIAGTRDGFDGVARSPEAVAEINASGADIVLVAMGVPRQELWIDAHRPLLDATLVLGVGALFDFLAGHVRRAPRLVRRVRLEWAWRLALEPRRLAKRYLIGNATFLARAAAHARATGRGDRVSRQQRVLDLAVAGCALAVLALPMALIAALVRIDSRGPAFFTQTRVGKDGVPFAVFKFRSMYLDAEARRAALLAQSDRAGICFKSRNDPRVTRVGRVLRRLSLDELPQLLNVLRGDMSIVGPRPALPEEVAQYPARALARLAVRPGITGLWQVSGRANIDFDKMIDLDTAYVRARSPLLDLILIALTFRAVLSGRGAY